MYHLGWFSSGRDEAARQLLSAVCDAAQAGDIKAQIDFVFLSKAPRETAESDRFIQLATSYGIPIVCLSYQHFKNSYRGNDVQDCHEFQDWRLRYDREIMSRLTSFKPDLCILAGYMLIVGPEMCRKYDMINLHPAAPGGPTGTWQEVIWQLIERHTTETGVMMHVVTPELDRGPVASFCTFSLLGKPFDAYWRLLAHEKTDNLDKGKWEELFCLIRQYGLKREFPLIISTIRAFSEGLVRIEEGHVVDSRGKAIPGYDLTCEIDKLIQ